jgi:hypothetical protein
VKDVMNALADIGAHDTLAIVDSCFSGAGGRSVLPAGARPLLRVHDFAPDTPAQLALFTASQGDEISGPAAGENMGLFTKYVIQGLSSQVGVGQVDANRDGQISLRELADWVTPRVAQDAGQSGRQQHPSVVTGTGLGNADSFIVEYGVPQR